MSIEYEALARELLEKENTDLKEVFTPTGIKQYINYIKSLA